MNLNYDMISLFLIIFIFYYLLFIISKKYVVEGNVNSTMCDSFNTCDVWPYKLKSGGENINQCTGNTDNCSDDIKINNCCDQVAQMCQGNIQGSGFVDYNCNGPLNMPKLEALRLPRNCSDSSGRTDCWDSTEENGVPRGLDNCDISKKGTTCDLSGLPPEIGEEICCTDRSIFVKSGEEWGRPHLITEAIVKYIDLLNIQDRQSDEYERTLNEALEYLYEARQIDSGNNMDINELIKDWGATLGKTLGEGMCMGNIVSTNDFNCSSDGKKSIDYPFTKKSSLEEECCEIKGMCSGNTSSTENVVCPENMHLSNSSSKGSTIEECCEDDITCRGNTNIYLNYDCPVSMIPVLDADKIYGNTEEECCRYIGDMDPLEIVPSFENETIQGTISFNGDLLESVGEEGSALRIIFEKNFKNDLLGILNKERKITIVEGQINIKNIYSGSIIVDFEVVPAFTSGISISKEYFSYLLSGKIYFPTIELHTIGSVTNISIISWDNINYWPKWSWYVILSSITFLIAITIMI